MCSWRAVTLRHLRTAPRILTNAGIHRCITFCRSVCLTKVGQHILVTCAQGLRQSALFSNSFRCRSIGSVHYCSRFYERRRHNYRTCRQLTLSRVTATGWDTTGKRDTASMSGGSHRAASSFGAGSFEQGLPSALAASTKNVLELVN